MSIAIFPENVRLRTVALPTEHGGWGFVLEPVILGLVLAPSYVGFMIGLSALAGFLSRHPIKILWNDYSAGRNVPRTQAAIVFGGIYFVSATGFLAVAMSYGMRPFAPFAVALPMMGAVLLYDFLGKSRTLVPEMLAPVALGSTVASIAIAGGWSFVGAMVLWSLLAARWTPTVLYVRSRLRLEYGREAEMVLPAVAHLLAIGFAMLLVMIDLAPPLMITAFALLLARNLIGLSRFRRSLTPQRVGFTEVGWGVVAVTIFALAYLT